MSENIIELKGITKRYGYGDTESFALKDFDLTIKRGEFIMIMGPSGCGKTTLLDIIGLLDRASYGDYYLNGENVASISSSRQARLRAKKIGFIFQDFNLIDGMPIIENVALPLIYAGYHKTARLKNASNALGRFNLQEKEYYLPYQLSGGQKQRVAIARAIVGEPEIILADEPTGNLDSRASYNVMEELKKIHSEGNTIIMVTHNPALTVYATRVINMLDGHIDTDIKTVTDADLPQPISVKIKKKPFEPKISEPAEPVKVTRKVGTTKKTEQPKKVETSKETETPEKPTPSKKPKKSTKTTSKKSKVNVDTILPKKAQPRKKSTRRKK